MDSICVDLCISTRSSPSNQPCRTKDLDVLLPVQSPQQLMESSPSTGFSARTGKRGETTRHGFARAAEELQFRSRCRDELAGSFQHVAVMQRLAFAIVVSRLAS